MRYLLALLALTTACASVQHPSEYDGPNQAVLHEAERCLSTGPCYVIQATNTSALDARLYVNGGYFDFVTGYATRSVPLFLPRGRLDGAGCVRIRVDLVAGGSTYSSTECLREGIHLLLEIDGGTGLMPLHVHLWPRANE